MTPIRGLQRGAALIGQGNLTHRIAIDTGDELEQLGHQFNAMADQLQDSYANLERKVEERTHQLALANQTLESVNRQLESANQAKSRFLANAAHDLRQPLHALGLFIGELPTVETAAAREHIVARIDTAIAIMNEQFKALLDISKLDAGALKPDIADLPVMKLFERIQNTFAGTAKERGLEFRVVPSTAWVSSDRLLLEQLLLNLVSNAVRYTSRGGVLVGCRRGRAPYPDRGMGYRSWNSRGSTQEDFRRILPARRPQERAQGRRLRSRPRHRGSAVPPARPFSHTFLHDWTRLLLCRDGPAGRRPRTSRRGAGPGDRAARPPGRQTHRRDR